MSDTKRILFPERPGQPHRVRYRPEGEHVRLLDVDADTGTEMFWVGEQQLPCKGDCAPLTRWHDVYITVLDSDMQIRAEPSACCKDCLNVQYGESKIVGTVRTPAS